MKNKETNIFISPSRILGAFALSFFLLAFFIHTANGFGKTRVFSDMLGNRIEVPDPLTRVALLGGPTGQIAYILGARNQLCAVTKSLKTSELINLMDPSVKSLAAPRTTSGQVNVEELILSDPQLVIAGDMDASIVEKKTRIPVARLKSTMNQSFDLIQEEIRFYGNAFGKEARAEKYVHYLQKTLARVQLKTKGIPKDKRKTVFNGYGTKSSGDAGRGHIHATAPGCRRMPQCGGIHSHFRNQRRRSAHWIGGSFHGKSAGMEPGYSGDRLWIAL